MKLKDRIEELERRVRELEARPVVYPPVYVPYPVPVPAVPTPYPYYPLGPIYTGGGDSVPVTTTIGMSGMQ